MSAPNPQSVHVLFVHGVGAHSRLSSFLQPWQALRANTRNPETAIEAEDQNPEWRLEVFDHGAPTPYLKMQRPGATFGETKNVYFYEVNYSELAGVVRRNHPLDLTTLFLGFDLAANVARARLRTNKPGPPPAGGYAVDHASLADAVQKLAGVFVAATVPILGLPSLVFRKYTQGAVATFTRFFEDIATFALDRNGEQLISAHVDRTIETIVHSERFSWDTRGHAADRLVIAAHSLGTVVTHSYLVRHRGRRDSYPSAVLTFGSPIGLVCWLWLFLDFKGMDFGRQWGTDPEDPPDSGARYFTWKTVAAAGTASPPIQWINVVNHLDPIATAFPLDYVDLAQSPEENRKLLEGGQVHHRFINTGSDAASAHTSYFDDRDGFLRILGRFARLRSDPPEEVLDPGSPAEALAAARRHWQDGIDALLGLRRLFWLCGFLAIEVYLAAIAWASPSWWILGLLVPLGCAPLTIGTLAFCQRFLCSRPTKRNSGEAIRKLPWDELASFPHRLRHAFRWQSAEHEEKTVMGPGPDAVQKHAMLLVSFVPSLLMMLLPLFALWYLHGFDVVSALVMEHWKLIPVALVVFMLYVIAFAVSEFAAQWRAAVITATKVRP